MSAPQGPRARRAARLLVFALVACAFGGRALADGAAAPPPPGCTAPECRQFDFWIGEWNVENPDGTIAGTNRIESILGGCVLLENWSGSRGGHGKSFNAWSQDDSLWHQTWVDDRGHRLDLAGTFKEGRMTLLGLSGTKDGPRVVNRITWRKIDADRVEQHWEISPDGVSNWQTAFLGLYKRMKEGTR